MVEADDRQIGARFDHLLAALGSPLPGAPTIRITIETSRSSGHGEGTYISAVDGELVLDSPDLREHELALTRVLNKRRLDAEPDLLHVHGSAVARNGRAVLIPGRSGSGKSTLAAALVRCGWEYVTDEQAVLQPDTGLLIAYPRPITLRMSAWPLFAGVPGVPADAPAAGELSQVELAPQDVGPVHGPQTVGISTVVAPRFLGNQADELRRIETAAETVEILSSSCHDLERLGAAGMATLVGLAATCNAWRLDFDDLGAAVKRVAQAFTTLPRTEPLNVRHIPPRASTRPVPGSVSRARSAHAWVFDDGSAVVYQPDTRVLARIDAAGAALWEWLGAPRPAHDLWVGKLSGGASESELRRWGEVLVSAGLIEIDDP